MVTWLKGKQRKKQEVRQRKGINEKKMIRNSEQDEKGTGKGAIEEVLQRQQTFMKLQFVY